MDPASNRSLVRYFQDRHVWLAQPDAVPVTLSVYDPSQPPDPPFRFVKLGTEAVEVLRSAEEIKQKILRKAAEKDMDASHLSCDQWNYVFTDVTGVESPNVALGCFPEGQRNQAIAFDRWFAWLERQQ